MTSKTDPTVRRAALLVGKVASDTWRAASSNGRPHGIRAGALDAAVAWLVRTHEATGRRGSSRGYSLLTGWSAAFPETTGYVIGTLLAYASSRGRDDLVSHAREMADWELEVQDSEGGIMQGLLGARHPQAIAFNTGMVLHGWLDIHAAVGGDSYLEAARRAGQWLVSRQHPSGAWTGAASYRGIPHTYKSRVSWALLRLAAVTGEEAPRAAAIRNLDWVLSTQQENGWFEHCNFEPGTLPNTHGIAYTLRGLVESSALTQDQRYLDAAALTSRALIRELRGRRTLPATWNAAWKPVARYLCLTGIVQLGGVWLRMYELTGEEDYRQGGLRAIEHAASYQLLDAPPSMNGALPGSFPIYGRYAPLACPNWATKFLADALMLRERAGMRSNGPRPVWG